MGKRQYFNDLERILTTHGVEIRTPSDITKPKMYWARDPLFVVDRNTFIAPQNGKRREELGLVQEFLQDESIPHSTMKVHGGNVLLPDRSRLFIGFNGSSPEESKIVCDEIAAITHRIVVAIHHTSIHLDTCMAFLPDMRLLMHENRIAAESRMRLEETLGKNRVCPIPTPPTDDAPILNLLWLNPTTVLAPANGIGDLLHSDGYAVIEMEGGEKFDGNVRCTVAPLIRGSSA